MQKIKVISESLLEQVSFDDDHLAGVLKRENCPQYCNELMFRRYIFNEKHGAEEWYINPCESEFRDPGRLPPLRVLADKENIKLVMIGSENFFPLLSRFADELIIYPTRMHPDALYKSRASVIGNKARFIKDHDNYQDIVAIRGIWLQDPEEVAEWCVNQPTYILQDAYQKFVSLLREGNMPKDLELICCGGPKYIPFCDKIKSYGVSLLGIDPPGGWQHEWLMEDHDRLHCYMSIQILASQFCNWRSLAVGGASNLYGAIPYKAAALIDIQHNKRVAAWERGVAKRLYGKMGEQCPLIIESERSGGKQVIPWNQHFLNKIWKDEMMDQIKENFDFLSKVKPCELEFVGFEPLTDVSKIEVEARQLSVSML